MTAETAQKALADLASYRRSGVAEFSRQRIGIVAQIAAGKSVDPQTLDRVLRSSECSEEQFQREVLHAVALADKKRAAIEAASITEQSQPLYDALAQAEAEFAKVQRAYLAKKEELEHQLFWLREPLKSHAGINQRIRDTAPEMPDSVRSLGWSDEIRMLGEEGRKLANPTGEPGPEATEEARKLWQTEERRRVERLAAIERRTAILNRAWELVRLNMCDEATGIWDQFSDPSRFLAMAEQEQAAKTKSTTVATV